MFGLNRDSLVLWFGFIGGLAGVVAANLGVFPADYQAAISSACTAIAAISGWLKSSPLAGAPKG